MARPSKLADKQWAEIERRLIDGESQYALAKEFGVTYNGIKKRFGSQIELKQNEIKAVANQIVTTERSLKALPVSSQVSALNLADKLRSISEHLGSAAEFGAMTAHRLSAIAHAQTAMIDDTATLEENAGALKSVMALTRGANDASTIGLNLLSANKEMAKPDNNKAPSGLLHFYGDDEQANAQPGA